MIYWKWMYNINIIDIREEDTYDVSNMFMEKIGPMKANGDTQIAKYVHVNNKNEGHKLLLLVNHNFIANYVVEVLTIVHYEIKKLLAIKGQGFK